MPAHDAVFKDSESIMSPVTFKVHHCEQGGGDFATRLSENGSHGEDAFFTPTNELDESVSIESQLLQALDVDHLRLLQAHASHQRKMSSQGVSTLALHSPSADIIGTPFATTTTRFEYPFPETHSTSSSPEPHFQPPPSLLLSSPSATSPSSAISQSLPSLAPYALPQHLSSTIHHPKILLHSREPPVPPGLIKKRHRWTLGLVGRRRSERLTLDRNAGGFFEGSNTVKRSFTDESYFGDRDPQVDEQEHPGLVIPEREMTGEGKEGSESELSEGDRLSIEMR